MFMPSLRCKAACGAEADILFGSSGAAHFMCSLFRAQERLGHLRIQEACYYDEGPVGARAFLRTQGISG